VTTDGPLWHDAADADELRELIGRGETLLEQLTEWVPKARREAASLRALTELASGLSSSLRPRGGK